MIYRHQWKDHLAVYNHTDRGFCKLTEFEEGCQRVACLHDLVVYPKKRGQGFGRELLAWAIGRATLDDCDALILWPGGEPWVEAWYQRNGFRESRAYESEDGEPCLMLKIIQG